MAFLLDTNVVSELRKKRPHPGVAAWSDRHEAADFFISSLVIGEVRAGVEKLRRRDPRRADDLDAWLDDLCVAFSDRVLPVSIEVAQEWGRLRARVGGPPIDSLMAATAGVHRLTLVTRNVGDFAGAGLSVVNPFDS